MKALAAAELSNSVGELKRYLSNIIGLYQTIEQEKNGMAGVAQRREAELLGQIETLKTSLVKKEEALKAADNQLAEIEKTLAHERNVFKDHSLDLEGQITKLKEAIKELSEKLQADSTTLQKDKAKLEDENGALLKKIENLKEKFLQSKKLSEEIIEKWQRLDYEKNAFEIAYNKQIEALNKQVEKERSDRLTVQQKTSQLVSDFNATFAILEATLKSKDALLAAQSTAPATTVATLSEGMTKFIKAFDTWRLRGTAIPHESVARIFEWLMSDSSHMLTLNSTGGFQKLGAM